MPACVNIVRARAIGSQLLLALCVGGLVVAPSAILAQSGAATIELQGRVFLAGDTMSLAGALIEVPGSGLSATAGKDGSYRLLGLTPGRVILHVRLLGLSSRTVVLELATAGVQQADIAMSRLPNTLNEVRINGKMRTVPPRFDEVYRRMKTSHGVFFTREDIEEIGPLDLKTLLQAVPTARVNDRGVTFARCENAGPKIGQTGRVAFFIDGFELHAEQRETFERIIPSQIQVLEVYSGATRIPPEYLNDACAVVAIWLR